MSHDNIATAARQWAAANEDGALRTPWRNSAWKTTRTAAVIVRAVLARAAWNREGAHARRQAGYDQ